MRYLGGSFKQNISLLLGSPQTVVIIAEVFMGSGIPLGFMKHSIILELREIPINPREILLDPSGISKSDAFFFLLLP